MLSWFQANWSLCWGYP